MKGLRMPVFLVLYPRLDVRAHKDAPILLQYVARPMAPCTAGTECGALAYSMDQFLASHCLRSA